MGKVLAGMFALWVLAPPDSLDAMLDAGHVKRARALAESRLKADPKDAEATYSLSTVQLAYGDEKSAEKLAEKALSLNAASAKYQFQLAQVHGAMAQKAGVFSQVGLARQFKEEAEKAVQLDPKYLDARIGLLEFYLQAPGILGGSNKKAREAAEIIGRLDAEAGLRAQARLAQEEKDVSGREQALLKALKVNPRSYEAETDLASFYAEERHDQELAEKHAKAAIELDPGRVTAYSTLACALAARQRWAETDSLLEDAAKAVPDDLVPYYRTGKALLLANSNLDRAERYFRKYLTQEREGGEPDLASAHWRLALVLEKESRKAEAVSELTAAVKLKPDFSDAKKDLERLR